MQASFQYGHHTNAIPARASDDDRDKDGKGDVGVVVKTKTKTKRPSLYKVLMLNDDYTPMEFVVYVLERFFNMDHGRAVEIMLTVHNRGLSGVGVRRRCTDKPPASSNWPAMPMHRCRWETRSFNAPSRCVWLN